MPASQKRKPRVTNASYKPRNFKNKNAPKTSAIALKKHKHENLTCNDWLTVVKYFDEHQPISQIECVKYFANKSDGALVFNQASLSRHLSDKGRAEDKEKAKCTSNGASSKRRRITTRPDIDEALILWVRSMEEKCEHVSGPMLMAKRAKFEAMLDIPEEERLKSTGWIQSFCKA